jgi:hypothetical protein
LTLKVRNVYPNLGRGCLIHMCYHWHIRCPIFNVIASILGFVTKARACKGAGQKWSPGITFHVHGSVRTWENELTHSQMGFHFESWSCDGLPIFQRTILGVKIHWIENSIIPLESSWNLNVWNGLSWPIWVLKT